MRPHTRNDEGGRIEERGGEWRTVEGMKRCPVVVGSPVVGSALPDGGRLTSFAFWVPEGRGWA